MNKNKQRFDFNYEKSNPVLYRFISNGNNKLLNFCFEKLHEKSKKEVKNFLEHKCISVNNFPTSQFDFELNKGDEIKIYKHSIKSNKNEKSKLDIIYEDDEFLVVNKPSGLLSVASDKNPFQNAFTYASDYLFRKDKKSKIFTVHRIDEDTSGVLIFVKNNSLRDTLTKNWNSFVLKRKYVGIVEGKLDKKKGKLINYLKENNLNLMYVTGDVLNGKKCITNYRVIKENKNYSMLDIDIETGRKNQIRVQFGHIGHFIIGDDKYGEPTNPIKRLGLHSSEVSLVHPKTKKKLIFKAPIPKIFFDLFKN